MTRDQRQRSDEQRRRDLDALKAHDEALARLRDAHRDTFQALLDAARAKRGLPPAGSVPKGRPRRDGGVAR